MGEQILAVVSISALAIWIVGKLELGLAVSGLFASIVASLVIVILRFMINVALGLVGALPEAWWMQWIVNSAAAFIVLAVAGRIGKGFRVDGYRGAVVAAMAVSVLTWLIGLVLLPF